MRYLIFSDVHGNLEALDALLHIQHKRKIDKIICLGDLVGYGASPNEVVQKVRKMKPLSIIRGNHDKAVTGQDSVESFNPVAAAAIRWTEQELKADNADFLRRLPRGPQAVDDAFLICHGSPSDEDYYIFGEFDADEAFGALDRPIGFFGHTHFPFVYIRRNGALQGIYIESDGTEIAVEPNAFYLINPGSIGQPRDRNPKSSAAIYDAGRRTVTFLRFEYDVKKAQKRIRDAGLPDALAERLSLGI